MSINYSLTSSDTGIGESQSNILLFNHILHFLHESRASELNPYGLDDALVGLGGGLYGGYPGVAGSYKTHTTPCGQGSCVGHLLTYLNNLFTVEHQRAPAQLVEGSAVVAVAIHIAGTTCSSLGRPCVA